MFDDKNEAVAENSNVPTTSLATDFTPLGLTETEIELLTDFIENGLYDPNLDRYVPKELPTGNCFPENDEVNVIDLGCG
ncbi:MAG: hypothetical protein AAGA77_09510 [Bacteroidota bacterium]